MQFRSSAYAFAYVAGVLTCLCSCYARACAYAYALVRISLWKSDGGGCGENIEKFMQRWMTEKNDTGGYSSYNVM